MRTATFIERSRNDQNISRTVKKEVPWQIPFESLKEGDIFEAEFGAGGKTIDFKVVKIIRTEDPFGFEETQTFYIDQAAEK